MLAHTAGGKLTKEAKFYTDWNCTQGFPVYNPWWSFESDLASLADWVQAFIF